MTSLSRLRFRPSSSLPYTRALGHNPRLSQLSVTTRPFSSSKLYHPRKDSQHKDSINTEATEYSKSGTDDEAARTEDTAFNPNITDPQEQEEKAQGEGGVSAKSEQSEKVQRYLFDTKSQAKCYTPRHPIIL